MSVIIMCKEEAVKHETWNEKEKRHRATAEQSWGDQSIIKNIMHTKFIKYALIIFFVSLWFWHKT